MKRRGTAELRHEFHRSFDDEKKHYNGRHPLLAVLRITWVGVASVRRCQAFCRRFEDESFSAAILLQCIYSSRVNSRRLRNDREDQTQGRDHACIYADLPAPDAGLAADRTSLLVAPSLLILTPATVRYRGHCSRAKSGMKSRLAARVKPGNEACMCI